MNELLFDYLLRLGDDRLVLGHRLAEWCSMAPTLEEDIALANMALDLLGQATALLALAGKVEGVGRTEDDLAFFRETTQFRNAGLVEQPNGDFAATMVRQFLFSAHAIVQCKELQKSSHLELGGIAGKALKECSYHFRYSGEWLVRLGDGTEESHSRAQSALDQLWPYVHELFVVSKVDEQLSQAGVAPDHRRFREAWDALVLPVLTQATLKIPEESNATFPTRGGIHSEHFGRLVSEMQCVARAHAGAKW